MTTPLYLRAWTGCRLAEALGRVPWGTVAAAILLSPRAARFAALGGGGFLDEQGAAADLDDPYELRLFNEDAELRWVRTHGPHGTAATVSETDLGWLALKQREDAARFGTRNLDAHALDGTQFLWGQSLASYPAPPPAGWTTQATARIGRFPIPFAPAKDCRAALRDRSYFERGEDGNLFLVAHRLMGFASIRPPARKDAK